MNINLNIASIISTQISNHLLWASILRESVILKHIEAPTPEVAHDSNRCSFGKWLTSEEATFVINDINLYNNIVSLHEQFHSCAAEVALLVADQDIEMATKMFGRTGRYCVASFELASALMALHNPSESSEMYNSMIGCKNCLNCRNGSNIDFCSDTNY